MYLYGWVPISLVGEGRRRRKRRRRRGARPDRRSSLPQLRVRPAGRRKRMKMWGPSFRAGWAGLGWADMGSIEYPSSQPDIPLSSSLHARNMFCTQGILGTHKLQMQCKRNRI
uniref:Uncharacterized protein n=1 Tax=Setaria italica TaxID=4555 RepID=K3Y061_SETIT